MLVFLAVAVVTPVSAAASSPMTGNWSHIATSAQPAARKDASFAYDPKGRYMLLFGGMTSISGACPPCSSIRNDTWKWTGSAWQQLHPRVSPPRNVGGLLAYDAKTGQMILFGGSSGLGGYTTTWLWTGTTWQQLHPTAHPNVFVLSSLCFDNATGQLLLVGYYPKTKAQTWVWTGTSWHRLLPASSPTVAGSIAYDPLTRQVVMFGGIWAGGTINQTWAWNGSNWTRQQPATTPPDRSRNGMAFDPQLSGVVVYGGNKFDATSPALIQLSDTWVWSGGDWRKVTTTHHPPVTSLMALGYDIQSNQFILFGGMGINLSSQTWRLSPT
jgi:hypothetical protein